MLRLSPAASAPSARIHPPPGLIPTSRKMVASGTPVHSALLVQPWESCTVGLIVASVHSEKEFPAHSRKWITETAGKRFRSSIVKSVGPLDQAMDEEPMLARVDGRDAPEVDLVEEGIGRERPVELGQGREADDRVRDRRGGPRSPRPGPARRRARTGRPGSASNRHVRRQVVGSVAASPAGVASWAAATLAFGSSRSSSALARPAPLEASAARRVRRERATRATLWPSRSGSMSAPHRANRGRPRRG